jgi:hypothetical protein
MHEDFDFDAAIVHHDYVCEVDLKLTGAQLQRLASVMQKQFPALTHLDLSCHDHPGTAPALPDGFLGGSAPCLQSLTLHYIPFPALPKLLFTATHLVRLTLANIPGHISPEAIAAILAVLVDLKYLDIQIECLPDRSEWESRRPLPPARVVLPALSQLVFLGGSKYLENLVARIDAPLLDFIFIRFFYRLIFDTAQLAQFMRRTTKFQAVNEAHVAIYGYSVQVESQLETPFLTFDERSGFTISCDEVDWEPSYLEKVFSSFAPSIHMVEHLYICGDRYLLSDLQEEIESTQWLDIFRSISAVKNLYVIKEFAECIAPALQDLVGERVREVLPALENLFVEELEPSGPIQEAIGKFVAARRLSGRPVAVSLWEIDYEQDIFCIYERRD